MKTIVNTKAVVNWKLLSFLFALSVVLHVIASATSPSHPLLSVSLALLEFIGWSYIGLIWGAYQGHPAMGTESLDQGMDGCIHA